MTSRTVEALIKERNVYQARADAETDLAYGLGLLAIVKELDAAIYNASQPVRWNPDVSDKGMAARRREEAKRNRRRPW